MKTAKRTQRKGFILPENGEVILYNSSKYITGVAIDSEPRGRRGGIRGVGRLRGGGAVQTESVLFPDVIIFFKSDVMKDNQVGN